MLKDATIVFDLDGTLVDTAPDLTNALNHALGQRGHAPVAPDLVRESAGRGARVMIEEALRATGARDDVDGMLTDFLRYYEANIAAMSRPFPGAVKALERLAGAGVTLAICTNKREHLTRMLLQALDIESYFSAIAGRDTFGVAKPDPAPLLGAIAAADGKADRAVMVGDSVVDLQAAHAANVPSILVTFGYSPPPPDGPRPDAVIDHFDALESAVLPLLKRLTETASAPS